MTIFWILAIAILGMIIGYGTVRIISIARNTRGHEFDKAALAASNLGVSLKESAQLMERK